MASFNDEYDLPALIRANLERYAALELKAGGYKEWDRPRVFLHAHVFDNVDLGEMAVDRIDIDWTEDDFRALCLVCPEADLTGQFVSREVRDRMPGPHDVPLPLEEA